jgi:hypothetical protein
MHYNFYLLLSASSFKEETTTDLVHCLSASDHKSWGIFRQRVNPLPLQPGSPPTPLPDGKAHRCEMPAKTGIFRIRHVSRNCLRLPRSDALLVCGLLHCFVTLTLFPPSTLSLLPQTSLAHGQDQKRKEGPGRKSYTSHYQGLRFLEFACTPKKCHISTIGYIECSYIECTMFQRVPLEPG